MNVVATNKVNRLIRDAGIKNFSQFTVSQLKQIGLKPVIELPQGTYWNESDIREVASKVILEKKKYAVNSVNKSINARDVISDFYGKRIKGPTDDVIAKIGGISGEIFRSRYGRGEILLIDNEQKEELEQKLSAHQKMHRDISGNLVTYSNHDSSSTLARLEKKLDLIMREFQIKEQ